MIDPREYQERVASAKASLATAKASLALAEATLSRRERAFKTGAVSEVEVAPVCANGEVEGGAEMAPEAVPFDSVENNETTAGQALAAPVRAPPGQFP